MLGVSCTIIFMQPILSSHCFFYFNWFQFPCVSNSSSSEDCDVPCTRFISNFMELFYLTGVYSMCKRIGELWTIFSSSVIWLRVVQHLILALSSLIYSREVERHYSKLREVERNTERVNSGARSLCCLLDHLEEEMYHKLQGLQFCFSFNALKHVPQLRQITSVVLHLHQVRLFKSSGS